MPLQLMLQNFIKHRSNIGRLIRHKESKLSFKKDLSDKFDDEDF